MITDSIDLIDSALKTALTGITSNIFYLEIPNEEILDQFTVTYQINGKEPVQTFYAISVLDSYELQIKISSRKRAEVITNSIYVQQGMNNLIGKVKAISFVNYAIEFDEDLNKYSNNLTYNFQN
jgi:hypothetical protein